MSNLQTYYHFKLDFQKVDQHTGGKWSIHSTKCRKDNQLQSLELPCRISMVQTWWVAKLADGPELLTGIFNWPRWKPNEC